MAGKARPRTPALDDLEATYRRSVGAVLAAHRAVGRASSPEAIDAATDDLGLALRALDMTHRLYTGEIRRLGGR